MRDAQGKLVGLSKDEGTAKAAPSAAAPPRDPQAMLALLAGRSIRLVETQISLTDQVSKFSADMRLATVQVQGDASSGATTLQGSGTLNGQPLDLSLSIPKDAALTARVTSGATSLDFAGADGSKGLSGALAGQIALESSDLAQTLKILQLEPVLHGTASARATLGQGEGGDLTLTGIEAAATLASGPSAQISGSLGNLRKLDDADITIDLRLYPEGQEPAPAILLKDLRLTSVHLTLAGPLKGDTRRSMTIATNGFEIDTAGVGPAPVKFSQISRGPQGQLGGWQPCDPDRAGGATLVEHPGSGGRSAEPVRTGAERAACLSDVNDHRRRRAAASGHSGQRQRCVPGFRQYRRACPV